MQVLGTRVLVKEIVKKEDTLLVTQESFKQGKVVSVGDDIKSVKVNDVVFYINGQTIFDEGKEYTLLYVNDLIAKK